MWFQLLRKEKTFIEKSPGKETGGNAQLSFPNPEFGVNFKALRGTDWYAEVVVGRVWLVGFVT